jgi:hypothetical protein
MSDLSPEEYQKQYDEAAAKLDAAATGTVTTTEPAKEEPAKQEETKTEPAAKAEPAKTDSTKDAPAETLEEIRARLEKAEKALKDTQAWGTKNAQRLAEIERERQAAQRAATRPAILDANPELAEAIKYVASDPAPRQQAEDKHQTWLQTIEAVHPGIFAVDADPELVDLLVAKRDASGNAWDDPLVAIRDITAEKLAHAERQIGKRFAIESAKQAEKTAMSVPPPGGGGKREAPNPDAEAVARIKNMSDAEFAKEVRRAKGL